MTNGYQKLENRIMNKVELFNDHFQNFKVYGIPKAQLIIADPPYNLGKNAYASNPSWYVDGDNKNGESDKAGKEFFDTDKDFRPAEFMHFCSQMLVKEPVVSYSISTSNHNLWRIRRYFQAHYHLNHILIFNGML